MIEASGVRRSCDTEVSRAERSRSRLGAAAAPGRCRRRASMRSMATAAWSTSGVEQAALGGAEQRPAASRASTPITPTRRGRCGSAGTASGAPGRVSVPRPAGWSASHDQRAAARSASSSSSSGGKAALRPSSLPVLGHQDHDLGVQQSRRPGADDGPQQVVEVDDAGDLAAEGVELGGGARPRARAASVCARVRAASALATMRHDHEEEQRHDIGRVARW